MSTSGQNRTFPGGIMGSLAILVVLLVGLQTLTGCSSVSDISSDVGKSVAKPVSDALNKCEGAQTSTLSDAIDASITITPTRYSIKDTGAIEITLTNATDLSGNFFNVTVELPNNFFQGLLIDYPTQPQHLKVDKPFVGNPVLHFFPELELRPNESVQFIVPVIAFAPGDFSGRFGITATSVHGSELKGDFSEKACFDVIVLP